VGTQNATTYHYSIFNLCNHFNHLSEKYKTITKGKLSVENIAKQELNKKK
jgi:hypothetical protein